MQEERVSTPRLVRVEVDGRSMVAYEGQTVAAVLWERGYRAFRRTFGGRPRGLFCGIGLCHDCLVTINGRPHQRACRTLVAPGMEIRTGLETP